MPLYESDPPSLPSCECLLPASTTPTAVAPLCRNPSLPLNSTPLPGHLHSWVWSTWLCLPCLPSTPELSSSFLGPASSPTRQASSCPALADTPYSYLWEHPSPSWVLTHTPGHPCMEVLFTLLMFQLSVPVKPGLLVPVGLLCYFDAPPRTPTSRCSSACTPRARLGFRGDALKGLQHSMPIHVGSLTLLRL